MLFGVIQLYCLYIEQYTYAMYGIQILSRGYNDARATDAEAGTGPNLERGRFKRGFPIINLQCDPSVRDVTVTGVVNVGHHSAKCRVSSKDKAISDSYWYICISCKDRISTDTENQSLLLCIIPKSIQRISAIWHPIGGV